MVQPKIEEMDFRPRIPIVRLALACLVFGVLAWVFASEKRLELSLSIRPMTALLAEIIGIGILLLLGFTLVTSFLLLQFRLRFTEVGIRRSTLFGPRFIPWNSVQAARVVRYRGYLGLELKVSRKRWICVPLMEYGRRASLLAEISRRVPVQVQASEKHLALLGEARPD